ncbi:MAG: hypothetical protein JWM82_2070 [Myxococcales bacterium]|nr:hypothetical protein [Myxococcales bacterium]
MRALTGIALLLLTASTSSPAVAQQSSAKAPRKLKFATGETIVDAGRDTDHVVVNDARGKLTSESWCDAETFDAYFTLFTDLKAALGRGDRAAVVKLVGYPLQVNAKRPLSLGNDAALSRAYEKVFTPKVLATVRKAEPAAVFCRDGQGMLGDGVIWAVASSGSAKATVVNP